MGVRKYVRDRKEVNAMRAQEDGRGAHALMGEALGYGRHHVNAKGNMVLEGGIGKPDDEHTFSESGPSGVTVIPAGSKPATPRNPLKGN